MRTIFAAFLLLAVTARAAEEKPLPRLPWHVVNLWWHFDKPTTNFQSIQIDVSINQDIDSSKINLYMAPIGLGELNGVKFYGSIQSNCNGWRADDPTRRERAHGGKGGIFSRWGKGNVSLDNARAAENGFYESAGYEGDFVSVRRPFTWKAGTYTYELQKLDYEKTKDGDFTWVGAFITEKQTGQRTYIGALRFPGKNLRLWNRNSAFIELYGTQFIHGYNIAELPALEIRFGQPRINGEPAKVTRLQVHYPTVKDGRDAPASPPLMDAKLSQDGSEIICTLHNKLIERSSDSFELKLSESRQPSGQTHHDLKRDWR